MATVDETFQMLEAGFRSHRWTLGTNVVVQYNISGREGGTWNAVVRDATCTISKGPATRPDVTVDLSSQEWLDMMSARVTFAEFVVSRKIKGKSDLLVAGLGLLGPIDSLRAPRPAWFDKHWFKETTGFTDTHFPGGIVDHPRFVRAGDYVRVRVTGFAGLTTFKAALRTTPSNASLSKTVATSILLSWVCLGVATCGLVVTLVLAYLRDWVAILALLLLTLTPLKLSGTLRRKAEEELRKKVREDADFYRRALEAGWLTIVSPK